MDEIELVVKVPGDVYRYAKKYNGSSMLTLREEEMGMCMNAIANGTPLPKGHGRMNELYKIAFDTIAHIIKKWNNDEEAQQADFEYLVEIQSCINAVVELPDSTTNGDVMKMLFGCGELSCDCDTDYESVIAYGLDTTSTCKGTLFTAKWWNAPYKGGQEE